MAADIQHKCKVMHIGCSNQQIDYHLNSSRRDKSIQGKDLGMIVSSDLKSSAHVAAITTKANSRLGIIKRNFTILTKDIMLPLYLSLVRPIVNYGAQSCSPYWARNIQALREHRGGQQKWY